MYAFGGAKREGNNIMQCRTIERLAKGKAQWEVMNLQMPEPAMDQGCFELDNKIVVFGGFSQEEMSKKCWHLDVHKEAIEQREGLERADFFQVNGVQVRAGAELWIAGHNNYHRFSGEGKFSLVI